MSKTIDVEKIKKFKNDLFKMDVNEYMEFVTPLTMHEWNVLKDFMIADFIYYFKTFNKIMYKFYKYRGKQQ